MSSFKLPGDFTSNLDDGSSPEECFTRAFGNCTSQKRAQCRKFIMNEFELQMAQDMLSYQRGDAWLIAKRFNELCSVFDKHGS